MLLKDKVVIITGVGPGMGRKLGSIAAAEGAKVALAARSPDFLGEVAAEIHSAGGACITVPTDIADAAQCQRLADETVKAFGRIDGLVNSAYKHASYRSFEEDEIATWLSSIDVTCFGALRMIKAVLPTMKAQKNGAIVNITALAAVQPAPGQYDYATAKAALEGATRQLAKEFGPHNIRVNCARMGWLWGAPVQGYIAHQVQSQGLAEADIVGPIVGRIPLGVIPPDEDCAKSALFFLSDYSRMVTGATLDVNGGEYMSA
jgi:NAD(P)-dependent dehydrogenase (short-subunit alcohol dehydrogenase family)